MSRRFPYRRRVEPRDRRATVRAGLRVGERRQAYSVTGTNTLDDQEQKERLRWTDDKGHYRPDLRNQGGTPLRNVA